MTDQQVARVRTMFAPDQAISSSIDMSYEFVRVATYGNNVPHTVVFMNDSGFLKVPVGDFRVGNYDEWKDTKVLPVFEVMKAAGALSLCR